MILIVIIKRNYDNKIAVKLFWMKKNTKLSANNSNNKDGNITYNNNNNDNQLWTLWTV